MFPLGARSLGWVKALAIVAALSSSKAASFLVPQRYLFGGSFSWDKVVKGCIPLNILVTNEEPTSGHRDVCSVGISPTGHLGRKSGQMQGETTFFLAGYFCVSG